MSLYDKKALENKILAITRRCADAQEFLELVESAGGTALALSTFEILPKPPSLIESSINKIFLEKYDYCLFLSYQSVDLLFQCSKRLNKTEALISSLNSTIVSAVGPKTSKKLEGYGVTVKLVPEEYSSSGVVSLFDSQESLKGKKVLIPRSEAANDYLSRALSSMGMDVIEIFLYAIKTADPDEVWNEFIYLLQKKSIDAVVFTSSSAVRSFFEIIQQLGLGLSSYLNNSRTSISIGPLTTEQLRTRNILCYESSEHTVRGAFELVKSLLGQKRI